MKEAYFKPETIASKSLELRREIPTSNRRSVRVTVSKAALLILDMQEYFLNPESHAYIPSAPAIMGNIKMLAAAFADRNAPVFISQHVNTEQDAGMMGRFWNDSMTEDHPYIGLVQELSDIQGILFRKTQYDAFYCTELEALLAKRRIGQLVITGVMTHLCCETTARSAFVRGYEPFIAIDGTATHTEAFHTASLLSAAHGFAYPLLCAEILEQIR